MGKKLTPKSNVKPKSADKPQEKKSTIQSLDPQVRNRIFIGGAVALAVVIALTIGLIRFYGEAVVARVNGINITESEVAQHLGAAEANLRAQQRDVLSDNFEREVREEAVRLAALPKLYESYGRGLGLRFGAGATSSQITTDVTNAIIDNPASFASFEHLMPEDPAHTATARAQAILDRLHAGEDFDTLMATYGEDPGMWGNPEGYTFIATQMVPEFSAGTEALEIGEISGLVRSDFGYHIIMRVEPDPYNVMHGVEADEEDLLGAKHILIDAREAPVNDRMRQAINEGFQDKLTGANFTFRSALDRVGN